MQTIRARLFVSYVFLIMLVGCVLLVVWSSASAAQHELHMLNIGSHNQIEMLMLRELVADLVDQVRHYAHSTDPEDLVRYRQRSEALITLTRRIPSKQDPTMDALLAEVSQLVLRSERVVLAASSGDVDAELVALDKETIAFDRRFDTALAERQTAVQRLDRTLAKTVWVTVVWGSGLLALSTIITSVGVYSVFRDLHSSLNQLVQALLAVCEGHYQQIPEQSLLAELEPLVHSYNLMSTELEQRQHKLTDQLRRTALLTTLSLELRESLDLQSILGHVLRVIHTNTASNHASILLLGRGGNIEMAVSIDDLHLQPVVPERARQVLEYGIAGWVLRHGSPVVIGNVAADERWVDLPGLSVGSAVCTPLTHTRTTLGVLTITHPERDHFTSRDLLLVEGIAAQAGVAISAALQHIQERRRREQALLLFAMSQFLTARRSSYDLARALLDKGSTVFDAARASLFLLDHSSDSLLRFADYPEEMVDSAWQPSTIATRVWREQTPLTEQLPAAEGEWLCVALPLLHNGDAIGVLVLAHNTQRAVLLSADVWSMLTTFTNVAAAAFANQQLIEQLEQRAQSLEQQVAQRTRQLQHSRDMLRIVFDNLPDGLMLTDEQTQILTVNRFFSRSILGRVPHQVVGRRYQEVVDELASYGDLKIEQQLSHDPERQQVLCTDLMGQQRWYSIERITIITDNGTVQRLERWRDVTRQEELHRKLQLHEQLVTLGRLAASVAHEIGNPFQTIRGCLDLCQEEVLPPICAEYLEMASTELDRINRLLDRLRELYRTPEYRWGLVDVNEIMTSVTQVLARQLNKRHVKLDLDLTPDLPIIHGQPDALRQVLLNLVLNAHDAMPSGGTIRVITSTNREMRSCRVNIIDTGVGISPERLKTIFDPFHERQPLQLGLGLYLSKMVVEQHRGQIQMMSRVGQGTSVVVCLPFGEVTG